MLQILAELPVIDFTKALDSVLTVVFGFITLLSVIFVIIGGFKYVTSSGSPEGIQKAKNTILYAIIGLAVGLLSNFIVYVVLGRLS